MPDRHVSTGDKYTVIIRDNEPMRFLRKEVPWDVANRDYADVNLILALAEDLYEERNTALALRREKGALEETIRVLQNETLALKNDVGSLRTGLELATADVKAVRDLLAEAERPKVVEQPAEKRFPQIAGNYPPNLQLYLVWLKGSRGPTPQVQAGDQAPAVGKDPNPPLSKIKITRDEALMSLKALAARYPYTNIEATS